MNLGTKGISMNSAILALTLLHPVFQSNSILSNAPTVGDRASYVIHITQNGTTMDADQSTSISDIVDFNDVKLLSEISFDGKTQTDTGQTTIAILNDLNSMVDHCSENTQTDQLAVLETVSVPAGTFITCHITNSSGEFFIGSVPFGIVKMKLRFEDGSTNETELTSFIKK